MPDLFKLGVDPITDGMTRTTLARIVRSRARALKALLLDQHVIAGIGNIYCDEILHASRLRHDRISNTLTGQEITRLHGRDPPHPRRGDRGRWVDPRRHPVRRRRRQRWPVPARAPCLRPVRAALHHLRQGRHRPGRQRRPHHALLPPLPALTRPARPVPMHRPRSATMSLTWGSSPERCPAADRDGEAAGPGSPSREARLGSTSRVSQVPHPQRFQILRRLDDDGPGTWRHRRRRPQRVRQVERGRRDRVGARAHRRRARCGRRRWTTSSSPAPRSVRRSAAPR